MAFKDHQELLLVVYIKKNPRTQANEKMLLANKLCKRNDMTVLFETMVKFSRLVRTALKYLRRSSILIVNFSNTTSEETIRRIVIGITCLYGLNLIRF